MNVVTILKLSLILQKLKDSKAEIQLEEISWWPLKMECYPMPVWEHYVINKMLS